MQKHDRVRLAGASAAALGMIGAAVFATLSAPPSFAQNTDDSGGPPGPVEERLTIVRPGGFPGHAGSQPPQGRPKTQAPPGPGTPTPPTKAAAPRAALVAPQAAPLQGYIYHGRAFARVPDRPYRWPAGYGYRRFYVGGHLPRVLRLSDYFIENFAAYQLDPPPPGYGWIRYGPDALLINVRTGRIVQAVLGMFG